MATRQFNITPTKMRALVYYGTGDLRVEERPVPEVGHGEVLVKVRFAGVCGTDIRIYSGTKKVSPPRILGHEFSGDVVFTGPGVGIPVGTKVTVYPTISCGCCYACAAGRSNICVNRKTIGYEYDGGFAEYVKVPAEAIEKGNLIPLSEKVSYEEAAISELLAAAYNGVVRAELKERDSVVIIGGGPVGICHVQLARLRGARPIIISELQEAKRNVALKFGADQVIDPTRENLRDRVLEITHGYGADTTLVDVATADAISDGIRVLKKGGRCVIFAGFPAGQQVTFDPNIIHYGEIVMTGSSSSTPEYHKVVLDLIGQKQVDLKSLLTASFTLEDWREAFEMKRTYQGFKSILKL